LPCGTATLPFLFMFTLWLIAIIKIHKIKKMVPIFFHMMYNL
jgi:hypothetical protein